MPGDTLVPAAGATDAERAAFYSKVTINADGMTFTDGSYPTSTITRLYVLAVPEPTTLTLLFVGLAALHVARHPRVQTAQRRHENPFIVGTARI
jgi:hypothetical protein